MHVNTLSVQSIAADGKLHASCATLVDKCLVRSLSLKPQFNSISYVVTISN